MITECVTCLYDESIPNITFDERGECSYCKQHWALNEKYLLKRHELPEMVEQMKREGKGKPYDVVVGVSGGCDSSYMLHIAVDYGLRPIACHFDNNFNEQIGVDNLNKILAKLKVPLDTYTIPKELAVDMMKSFMLAGVPDIDTPSDIALASAHYMCAKKHGIRWIWEGHNFRTEGISPIGFFYMDAKYIETVHDLFGTVSRELFPNLWLSKWLWWTLVNRIKKVRPHYYNAYNKENVKTLLHKLYDWDWYGGHHHENRTSYFTNRFWLYKKFGIDIRIVEYSAHIRSGSMTKKQAMELLREPPSCDPAILDEFSEMFGMDVMNMVEATPNMTFRHFKTYKETFEKLEPLFRMMLKAKLINEGFYYKYAK
jgi:hypothetical protein